MRPSEACIGPYTTGFTVFTGIASTGSFAKNASTSAIGGTVGGGIYFLRATRKLATFTIAVDSTSGVIATAAFLSVFFLTRGTSTISTSESSMGTEIGTEVASAGCSASKSSSSSTSLSYLATLEGPSADLFFSLFTGWVAAGAGRVESLS